MRISFKLNKHRRGGGDGQSVYKGGGGGVGGGVDIGALAERNQGGFKTGRKRKKLRAESLFLISG